MPKQIFIQRNQMYNSETQDIVPISSDAGIGHFLVSKEEDVWVTINDKTPWLTCSRCGSRRVQQKSEEKVRCLDCGYVEKFHIKHSYFLIEGNEDGNRKS